MRNVGIVSSSTLRAVASVFVAIGLFAPSTLVAWDVRCETAPGVDCPDPFSAARTPWRAHPRAEHRLLLKVSMDVSGLPPSLQEEFELKVFVDDTRMVRTDEGDEYPSIVPVLREATGLERRTASIPMFANLPDFAYTLWDWAAGNELCPPDPSNDDPFDCHEYETHIGWLNSNHMLPQSRRWYEHMHALAMERAARCKLEYERTPPEDRDRMRRYHEACEKLALVLEAVGHHYLQDSWAVGHMWERWGSTEPADFRGTAELSDLQNRALGFWVGFFTGTIHGAKAVLDEHWLTGWDGPWDDPLNAPHPDVSFRDATGRHPGVGDIFLAALFGFDPTLPVEPQYEYSIQRKALLGCAVSGLREVYAATARVHGRLEDANETEADLARTVRNDSCWSQRVTNRALSEGFGLHGGRAPYQIPVGNMAGGLAGPLIASMTLVALASQGPDFTLDDQLTRIFQLDAAYAATLALAKGLFPATANDTDLASGGLPSLAGIRPNHHYARGNAELKQPPAFYADPFLPWPVLAADASTESGKYLNLAFSDANAGERCAELTASDLEAWRDLASAAYNSGTHAVVRCGQCVAMVAPHLRRGRAGDYDRSREAYCARVEPTSSQFVYTGEDSSSFTGTEPKTFEALEAAALEWCGCTDDGGSEPPPPPPPPPPGNIRVFGNYGFTLRAFDCETQQARTDLALSAGLSADGSPAVRTTGWPGIVEATLSSEVVNIATNSPGSTTLKVALVNAIGRRPSSCTGTHDSSAQVKYELFVPVPARYSIRHQLSEDATNSNLIFRLGDKSTLLYTASKNGPGQGTANGSLEPGRYSIQILTNTAHRYSYETGSAVVVPDPITADQSFEIKIDLQ